MSKKIKRPPLNEGQKVKLSSSTEFDPNKVPPYFSLRYLSSDFCISKCEQRDKLGFVETLRKLSLLTWEQINVVNRHKLGYEKIDRNIIRATIPRHLTPDVTLIAFRFSDMKPMVGYRNNATFYILWFDRDRDLYPHE